MTTSDESTARDAAPPVRVACWPSTVGQPYLESLYQALEPYGIRVSVDGLAFENAFLDRRRHEFDVVHLHWTEYLWGAGSKGRAGRARDILGVWRFVRHAKRLGVPVLWTVHNLQPHDGGDWIDRFGYQIMCWYSALPICHDETTKNELQRRFRLGAAEPLVMRIGNNKLIWPAPDPHATVRAELGVGPDVRLLICFGHLRPYKGFEVAVAGMKELGEGYHLVIVGPPGNPPYALELQQLAAGAKNITVMADRVETQYLVDLLEAADCVLFPYRQITGSAALLGAFTAGKGVVASDLPYFRETLSFAPDAGLVFRVGDAIDLARAVREFFTVPLDVRGAAANTISAAHDWPQAVGPLAEWLNKLRPVRPRTKAP